MMNERIRFACWKAGKKLGSNRLKNKFAPESYKYAERHIPCVCPGCKCPAGSHCRYSFVYIDESHRLMYYDVPKSASTTIRKAFFGNELSASMTNPKYDLEKYFKFTFVRNPWGRMVSNWKMFTTQPSRIAQLKTMTREDLSRFEDFVYFAIKNSNHHWQPQAIYTPKNINFIGKIESFDVDMERMLTLISKSPKEMGKHNSTQQIRYQDCYTPSLADVVAEFYLDDIERFDYQF